MAWERELDRAFYEAHRRTILKVFGILATFLLLVSRPQYFLGSEIWPKCGKLKLKGEYSVDNDILSFYIIYKISGKKNWKKKKIHHMCIMDTLILIW
jgi:hypothetical protein